MTTTSPNPEKTCETCVLGIRSNEYTDYYCNNSRIVDARECTYEVCGIDNKVIIGSCVRDALPKKGSCETCPYLSITKIVVLDCHLTNQTVKKSGDDFCGQWKDKF